MSHDSKPNRSSLAAFLALLKSGDFAGLARKAQTIGRRHLPTLPANFRPQPRPAGERSRRSAHGPPRVLMVGSSLSLTGAPISQFELAVGLGETAFAVEVVAPSEGPVHKRYAGTGIGCTVLPELACDTSIPEWYETDIAALAARLRQTDPDVVFANTIDAFPVIDAARLAGIPTVWNIRESEPWQSRLADRHVAVAARALAALAYPQSLIFVAQASLRAWSRFAPAAKSHVIYNAPHPWLLVDPRPDRPALRQRLGLPLDGSLAVSVGTVTERKGQIDLALALARLPPETRPTVAFVGEANGAYASRLRQMVGSDRVAFTGAVDDARDYIAAADALVNTSRSEAFPRIFLEAAALRTPIVASRVDGAGERLKHEHSAMLYAPGDDAELAAILTRLQAGPALGEHLTRHAFKDLVESWTFADMLAAYEARLREAIA